ncbi:hypothetical protein [Streptomyces megasporus]|uniref:hypothetical protein n=1 Tax=Streptomyces megasporus TaxID=44060 RepID=UPI0004E2137C|nr:hypothetical protein [Streptomyces megasporus]
MPPTWQEIDDGINRIEGYLLVQAERSNAHRDAEALARRMPWLTASQHDEFVRLYSEDRLRLTERSLRRIADRTAELRAEYGSRYRRLFLITWCIATLVSVFIGALGAVLAPW